MKRLRNSKGQFISKNAEEGIRQISNEHGVKGTEKIQQYFIQNENEFRGLFTETYEAKFSTDNASSYLQRNFDNFKINNGRETFKVSRTQAQLLIEQFQRYQIRTGGGNFSLFNGEMTNKDKNGSFHDLTIKLPIKKTKTGKYRVDSEILEAMEEDGDIETYRKSSK